jgi:hypothetical protein
MNLCKYKDIFGKPGTGVHSYRLFGIAIVDLLMTLAFAWFLSVYTELTFFGASLFMIVVGIVFHRVFCVDTTLNKLIFKN